MTRSQVQSYKSFDAALLLDTGAFVALIDRSERRHMDCVAALEQWSGPIVTSEAVLTETLYLVGPSWKAQRVCFEFFLRGAFLLIPSSVESLRRVAALMEKYRDIPMDFADATLVALGEELDTDQVFTLDQRGFSTYRLSGKKPFRTIP
ncbi:MAG TPA: PIN domain-containing protein [Anaerolineae bacterium]|nr:PIN domain-containing protein [Anaerolineae bacterium]